MCSLGKVGNNVLLSVTSHRSLVHYSTLVQQNQVIKRVEDLRRRLVDGKQHTSTCIRDLLENLTQLDSRKRVETTRGFIQEEQFGFLKEERVREGSAMRHVPSKKQALTTTSSTPTLVRLRSPPEIPLISAPPTIVSAHEVNPSSVIMRCVSLSRSCSVVSRGKRSLAEKRIASLGVAVTCKESS